jgi:dephospho-CoA kinase
MLAENALNALMQAGLLALTDGRVRFAESWLARFCAGQPAFGMENVALGGLWGEKIVIGLTGNIATGKSTVLGMLRRLGATVIDADRLVHQLREPGMPGFQAVVDLLGPSILLPDGRLDRRSLAQRAFDNPALLRQLEMIFRPLVVAEVERMGRAAAARVIVVEAIKLLEGGLAGQSDLIWVVDAPRVVQIARLMSDREMTREEAETRVDVQNPQREKLARADVVITNAGDLAETRQQVLVGWREILRRLYAAGWLELDLIAQYLQQATFQAGTRLEGGQALDALQRLAVEIPENGLPYQEALARLNR